MATRIGLGREEHGRNTCRKAGVHEAHREVDQAVAHKFQQERWVSGEEIGREVVDGEVEKVHVGGRR